ncbi:MAG: penicillin acylase family protein [Chitinophagales bacterium]|nr:penicillin acylase family protein [Chitinophagales bacterium]
MLLLLTSSTLLAQTIDPSKIDIVRDSFGVPHIFAKTDAEVAYGLAWATAEDDFETMQWGLLAGKAMMGRHSGKEGAIIDYVNHLLRISDVVEAKYETSFSPEFKRIMDAYAQGANKYAKEHPREVLVKKAFPITAKDMAKGYVFAMSLMSDVGSVLQKVLSGEILDADERFRGIGSNAFAFNSNSTQDGNTYLNINSHQPIEGPLSWYEAHLCSEEGWNIVGGLFHGSVSILHGTNEYLGWAHTVNVFDPIDVFQLTMHPTEKNKYKFDGEWFDLEERKAKLTVKLFKKFPLKLSVKKKVWWSKYGATLKTKQGVFSVKLAANEVIHAPEQWFHMNKTKNYSEFRKTLDMQGMAKMTVVYADRYDTIYALCNGLVPKRNPNYNWRRVVPGDTSATLWTEYYPESALPQVLNPECGYVFNVNNSPFEATCEYSDVMMENYEPAMGYNLLKTNRSERFLELMKDYEFKGVTWNDFLRIKYDAQMPDSLIFANGINLNDIFKIDPKKYPDIADALENIRTWNRQATLENTDCTIFLYTFYNSFEYAFKRFHTYDIDAVAREEMFVKCIRKAKEFLMQKFGTIDVPLGQVQFLVRGDKELPVGGCPDALKAAYSKPYKDGLMKLWVGESYIQLVKFSKNGPEIESISPFGASNKIGHKHSTDQMELYLSEKRKKMPLDKQTVYKLAEAIYNPH